MPQTKPRRRQRKGGHSPSALDAGLATQHRLEDEANGIYRYGTGIARFEGSLDDDGNRHGQGSYTWESGANYQGGWRQGVMHGTGIMTYSNGDSYVGGWEDGVISGVGRKRSLALGSIEQGCYEAGGDSCVGPVQVCA